MKKLITKGTWYYEIQILMIVFMWRHSDYNPEYYPLPSERGFRWGRLHIWHDTTWKNRGKVGDFFWSDPKNMFIRWFNSQKPIRFIRSLQSYLRLTRAGFEIGYWSDPDLKGRYERYRFFWKEKLVREMPDIVCVDNNYSTVNNGHQEYLFQEPKPQYNLAKEYHSHL